MPYAEPLVDVKAPRLCVCLLCLQVNALIAARKPYDLLLFPDERHSPRQLQDRVYMEQRIADFLISHLVS